MRLLFFHGMGGRNSPHVEHDVKFDGDVTSETRQHHISNVDVEDGEVTIYTSPESRQGGECWYFTLTEDEMHLLFTMYQGAKVGAGRWMVMWGGGEDGRGGSSC